MFDLYFPQTLIRSRNILYDYETRQLGDANSIPRLRAYSKVCVVLIHVAIWAYTLLALMLGTFQGTHILAFALVSTGVGFAADVYAFIIAFGHAARFTAERELDLLRLTPISAADIVAARLATTQIRVWRGMILETLLRLIIIEALFSLVVLNLPFYHERGFTIWVLMPFAVPGLIATVVLYHEPQWRLRMITTLAHWLGTTVHQTSLGFLAGISVVVGALALRIVLMYGFYFVVVRTIGPFTPFLWLPLTPFALAVKFVIQNGYLLIEYWTKHWAIDFIR